MARSVDGTPTFGCGGSDGRSAEAGGGGDDAGERATRTFSRLARMRRRERICGNCASVEANCCRCWYTSTTDAPPWAKRSSIRSRNVRLTSTCLVTSASCSRCSTRLKYVWATSADSSSAVAWRSSREAAVSNSAALRTDLSRCHRSTSHESCRPAATRSLLASLVLGHVRSTEAAASSDGNSRAAAWRSNAADCSIRRRACCRSRLSDKASSTRPVRRSSPSARHQRCSRSTPSTEMENALPPGIVGSVDSLTACTAQPVTRHATSTAQSKVSRASRASRCLEQVFLPVLINPIRPRAIRGSHNGHRSYQPSSSCNSIRQGSRTTTCSSSGFKVNAGRLCRHGGVSRPRWGQSAPLRCLSRFSKRLTPVSRRPRRRDRHGCCRHRRWCAIAIARHR